MTLAQQLPRSGRADGLTVVRSFAQHVADGAAERKKINRGEALRSITTIAVIARSEDERFRSTRQTTCKERAYPRMKSR